MRLTNREIRLIIKEELMGSSSRMLVEENDISQLAGDLGNKKAMDLLSAYPDAARIYFALSGAGTDEEAVREVLARRENDIVALYSEYTSFLDELKKEARGFSRKLKKYGLTFLKSSAAFSLVSGALGFGGGTGAAIVGSIIAGQPIGGNLPVDMGIKQMTHPGNLAYGAVFTAIVAAVSELIPDGYDYDLIGWLEDDGMHEEAKMVQQKMAQAGAPSKMSESQLRRRIRRSILNEVPMSGDPLTDFQFAVDTDARIMAATGKTRTGQELSDKEKKDVKALVDQMKTDAETIKTIKSALRSAAERWNRSTLADWTIKIPGVAGAEDYSWSEFGLDLAILFAAGAFGKGVARFAFGKIKQTSRGARIATGALEKTAEKFGDEKAKILMQVLGAGGILAVGKGIEVPTEAGLKKMKKWAGLNEKDKREMARATVSALKSLEDIPNMEIKITPKEALKLIKASEKEGKQLFKKPEDLVKFKDALKKWQEMSGKKGS